MAASGLRRAQEGAGQADVTRTALLLLFVWLLAGAACAACSTSTWPHRCSAPRSAFITPRTLEPESIPQLTLWGLRGLTAFDPALMPELRETGAAPAAGRPADLHRPAADGATPAGWGALAAAIVRRRLCRSDPVRQAGTAGVIRSFFDELFNHLDPYSRYVPPGAAETERDRRSGQAGLGLTVVRQRGVVTVDQVTRAARPTMPACGPATASPPSTAARPRRGRRRRGGWIAGPEGSTVRLAWRSQLAARTRSEIERALVPPQTVTAERLGDVVLIHDHRLQRRHRRPIRRRAGGRLRRARGAGPGDRPARQPRRPAAPGGRRRGPGAGRTAWSPPPPGATRRAAASGPAAPARTPRMAARSWCWWTAAPPARRRSWPQRWPITAAPWWSAAPRWARAWCRPFPRCRMAASCS